VLCVGQCGVGLGERVCAVCGRVLCGFGRASVCFVWDSLVWVWWSEFVLCVGHFGVGLGECVCAVFGRVLCGFGGMSVCCV